MNEKENIEEELAKMEKTKEKRMKKILSKENIERLANRIADEVASNCRYVIPCKAGDACESGLTDFECQNTGIAFECSSSFICGGSKGSHDFGCDGGSIDDYECEGYFNCPKSFNCSTSFDDEDCQPTWSFACSSSQFGCSSGNEYN